MHVRFQERREELARGNAGRREAVYAEMFQLIDALRDQVICIRALSADTRLEPLADTVRSARLLLDMTRRGGRQELDLMPCIIASLVHVKTQLMRVADSINGVTEGDAGRR